MADEAREGLADVAARCSAGCVWSVPRCRTIAMLVLAFVELGVLECDRERAHRRVGEAADQRDDAGGIQPAAEVRADRHVGAQLQAHGIDQQFAQFRGGLLRRCG